MKHTSVNHRLLNDGSASFHIVDTKFLVSVIVPVFNVLPYLVEALESVLNQIYTNLEIIIIDDGSTDGSAEICDEYSEKDPRVIVVHQENQGLSGARNTGLNMATGDAIAFLDSDDVICPDFISSMERVMRRDGVDLVICDYTVGRATRITRKKAFVKSSDVQIKQGIYTRDDALRALADGRIKHYTWNKLYRRELWERIRFPVGHVYEDVYTTYRIMDLCERVFVLNEPLYHYRKRRGSIVDDRSQGNLLDSINASSCLESYVRKNTPSIFSVKQLTHVRIPSIKGMIIYYSRFSGKHSIEVDEQCNKLRLSALSAIEEIGVCNCETKIRFCYWILRRSPWLLRSIYPMYHFVHQLSK